MERGAEMTYCPHCGQSIQLVKGGHSRRASKTRFESGYGATGQAEAPVPIIERRGPARDATVESDVHVPVLQAGITGIVAFAVSIIPIFAWGWAWWSPFVVGLLTFAAVWLALLNSHRQSLWLIEDALDRDLNGDGQIGKPASIEPIRVDIIETQDDGRKAFKFVDLVGVQPKQLYTFAFAVTSLDKSLAEEVWTPSANGFSKRKYRTFMQRLDDIGWTRFVNPAHPWQGRALTTAGRRILANIAQGRVQS
jgi:hypothetical protein